MEEVMEMAEVKVVLIAQVKVMLRSKLKSRSMSVIAISKMQVYHEKFWN